MDQSTPISSLNNDPDDTQVVNQILNKYNNLQNGGGELPPLNPAIPQMESQFENRNLGTEVYNHNSKNVAYDKDYQKEQQRIAQYQKQQYEDDADEDDDEYEVEEYEVEEIPLWKKILNDIRIPVFIFAFILIFFNKTSERFLVKKFHFFGNQYNEKNLYGFLFLAFLVAVCSYLFIRFAKI